MNDAEIFRFCQKVQQDGDCWVWTGATSEGYGLVRHQGKVRRAHRVIWQYVRGPIPEGMLLDHICHNRACVSPDHLRIATHKQNGENLLLYRNSKSGHRGVSWNSKNKEWRATVCHNRKRIFLGCFDDPEEAAAVVKAKRNELFTFNDADRRVNL